ncbi:MAG: hypothetical protein ACLUVV_03055 [Christensenellales bacterium]
MVILLTGATHTGKTVLAQRLMERLAIPYCSLDHLKMGLIRSGCTALTPIRTMRSPIFSGPLRAKWPKPWWKTAKA